MVLVHFRLLAGHLLDAVAAAATDGLLVGLNMLLLCKVAVVQAVAVVNDVVVSLLWNRILLLLLWSRILLLLWSRVLLLSGCKLLLWSRILLLFLRQLQWPVIGCGWDR